MSFNKKFKWLQEILKEVNLHSDGCFDYGTNQYYFGAKKALYIIIICYYQFISSIPSCFLISCLKYVPLFALPKWIVVLNTRFCLKVKSVKSSEQIHHVWRTYHIFNRKHLKWIYNIYFCAYIIATSAFKSTVSMELI